MSSRLVPDAQTMAHQPKNPLSTAITSLPPSLQILYQKQQEHAGLQALRESSAELLERVEKLAEMSHVMADGGEGVSTPSLRDTVLMERV